jgi:hypothetical protein
LPPLKLERRLQHFQFCCVGLSFGILFFFILEITTKIATFSFLSCWAFFRDTVFFYFIVTSVLFVPCGGWKSLPVHLINDVIFSILEDRSARHYCCACGIFSFNFSVFSSWFVPIFLLEYSWITLRIWCLLFKFVF